MCGFQKPLQFRTAIWAAVEILCNRPTEAWSAARQRCSPVFLRRNHKEDILSWQIAKRIPLSVFQIVFNAVDSIDLFWKKNKADNAFLRPNSRILQCLKVQFLPLKSAHRPFTNFDRFRGSGFRVQGLGVLSTISKMPL